jgi:hypothetical protein
MDFTNDGIRFSSYHSNLSGTHKTHLKIDEYDPSNHAWSDMHNFEMTNPANITTNWPSLSIGVDSTTDTMVTVANDRLDTDVLVWWTCGTSEANCDSAAEWGTGTATDVTGADTIQPEALGIHLDRIAIYESAGRIAMISMCDGEATWSDYGLMALHTDYNSSPDCRMSALPVGSAKPQVTFSQGTIYVGYLCQHDSTGLFNPLVTEIEVSSVCP